MVVSGNHQVRLSVAEVSMALTAEGVQRDLLHEDSYRPFITSAAPVATIDITTNLLAPGDSLAQAGPRFTLRGHELFYQIHGGEGYLDAASGRGWLQSSPDEGLARAILVNFIRGVYAVLLVRHGGFLFHSAGMIRSGRGYVFYGHSGSGKSTVSRLSRQWAALLSDDLVAVRLHDGAWRVYGTPFWGDRGDAPFLDDSAPLRALFGLVKDGEVKIERLAAEFAVADVLSSVPVICAEPSLGARLLDLSANLVSRVPCYHLHLTQNDSFWRLIDELA